MTLPGSLNGPTILDNYDVLLKILDDVALSREDSSQGRRRRDLEVDHGSTQRDLAACALVCHSYTEPALRLLWGRIDSLLPLWHLLAPAATARPTTCTEQYINLVVEAKLYEDGDRWDRFLRHSKLVRRLFYDSSTCADAQARLFKILLEHNGGEPFLPSLRAIEWDRASSQDYSFAVAFCPELVDISLGFARQGSSAQLWRDIDLRPLLHRLREASPSLETLQLKIPAVVESWIVDELVQFPRLRNLHGSFTLDLPSFATLVSKLSLVSLRMTLSDGPVLGAPTPPGLQALPPMRMETLQELKIQGHTRIATQLFAALAAPQLRSLTVRIVDRSNNAVDCPAFIDAIAGAVSADAMRTLALTIYVHHNVMRPPLPAPIPLATLFHPFSATDETFADIARRWRALRTFELGICEWHPARSSPSSAVLVLFARECPDLRRLTLPYLDYRATARLPSGGGSISPPHPLCHLDIYDSFMQREFSTEDDITRIAEYIHGLFPSIDVALRQYGGRTALAWTKVFHRIRALQDADSFSPAPTLA